MEVAEAVCRPDFYLSSQVVHLQRVIDEGPMKYPSDIAPNTHVVSSPDKAGTCPLSPGRLAFSRAAVSRFHRSCFYYSVKASCSA